MRKGGLAPAIGVLVIVCALAAACTIAPGQSADPGSPGLPVADPRSAPTTTAPSPDGPPPSSTTPIARPHEVEQVSVDNVGPTVRVRALHRGERWSGSVTIDLFGATRKSKNDGSKNDGSENDRSRSTRHRTVVARSDRDRTRVRSSIRSGRRDKTWFCQGRTAHSVSSDRETVLEVPRSCLDGSAQVRAVVTAETTDGQRSVHVSRSALQEKQPNVVVIMVDDMRDDELDGPWMENTRRWLADGGVRFTNSFAPLPLCCPARASFLTGQYPHNHGVWSHQPPYGFGVFRDEETLPVWLDRAGYSTYHLGKYLNGYGVRPTTKGRPSARYVPPGWDDWNASLDASGYKRGTYNYLRTVLNSNGRHTSLRGSYQTSAYGRIARKAVAQKAGGRRPFFMWLSFTAPHFGQPTEPDDPTNVVGPDGDEYRLPTPARPRWVRGTFDDDVPLAPGFQGEDDMSDKPEHLQQPAPLTLSEQTAVRDLARQRAEAEHVVDLQVDRVMKQLERSGELDNTYVVFTSDNGYFLGEHRRREGKVLPYEPSLRTPLLIRGPGIPAGEVRQDPFTSMDFAPTIVQMAGADAGGLEIDGASLLDVSRAGDEGWSRAVVTETGPVVVPTMLDLDLDGDSGPGDESSGLEPTGASTEDRSRGLRVDDYLYVETNGREPELYDLRADPGQTESVVEDPAYAAVRERLDTLLERLQSCRGAACRAVLPDDLRKPAGSVRSGG